MTWALISPVFLLVIFLVGVITWEEHMYSVVVPYPEWATWIGWGLVGISAVQIPLWAVLMTLYYLIKGRPSQVVLFTNTPYHQYCCDLSLYQVIKPTPEWGPGDKAVRRAILDEQQGIARSNKYSYDNEGMNYNYHM